MRAYADDEQPELLDEPSLLGLSLWIAKDFDLLASSQAVRRGPMPASAFTLIDAPTTTLLLVRDDSVKGAVYQPQDDDALIRMARASTFAQEHSRNVRAARSCKPHA